MRKTFSTRLKQITINVMIQRVETTREKSQGSYLDTLIALDAKHGLVEKYSGKD